MRHPPGIRKLVDKTHPQNTGTHRVILYAGGTHEVGSRRPWYFRFLFILHIPGRLGGKSTGWGPSAQMLDLFRHLVAHRASDDQTIGTIVLLPPACEIVLLPLVHDLAQLSILRFITLVFLFLCQLLPIGVLGLIHP